MKADKQGVGVIGASSLIGGLLLSKLSSSGLSVHAFTRGVPAESEEGINWRRLGENYSQNEFSHSSEDAGIRDWVCVAPIWVLQEHFPLLEANGVRRVVVLSSTSRFTKECSSHSMERETADRLTQSEHVLQAWAEANSVEWIILRPTLIYGQGRDKNIAEIARFIRRFGFFPLFGAATGLREPVHADDVAEACLSALLNTDIRDRAYNLSGGERLPYRDMVARVFSAMKRKERVLKVPLWVFRIMVSLLRLVPRYRHWSVAMAERMNQDLVFDHIDAARDFGFSPRRFELKPVDVGK
ncbi:MAG: NAD-dependent epimerase/dehydratase family protein [Candidatus Sedimenticola sp. 20ELBAFRAG]